MTNPFIVLLASVLIGISSYALYLSHQISVLYFGTIGIILGIYFLYKGFTIDKEDSSK